MNHLATKMMILLAFLLLCCERAPDQSPVSGQPRIVVRVVDGDTIVLDRDERVRLIGVDTPETVHPSRPVEFFGKEASSFTKKMANGKTVWLEYDQTRQDRYGRTLAYVHLANGVVLNEEIIRQGYGHAYLRFPFKYRDRYKHLEAEARSARRGLWANSSTSVKTTGAENQRTTASVVFITPNGRKFHRANCSHLRKARRTISLEDAKSRGYGPCSRCRPLGK